MNVIEFMNKYGIRWFPIKLDNKTPMYTDNYQPKQNDFETCCKDELIDRQKCVNKYDYIAIDTRKYKHIDIDMEKDKFYSDDNYTFIKEMVKTLPFYKSLSSETTKPQGKHFFFKNKDYEFDSKRPQTIYKDIEILSGQWAWIKKTQKIICPPNYNINMCKTEIQKFMPKTNKPKFKIKAEPVAEPVAEQIVPIVPIVPAAEPVHLDTRTTSIIYNIDTKYIDCYDSWIKIVWAIKSCGEEYKDAAILLSSRSEKYTEEGFNKIWNKNSKLTMGTLCYYSKLSNPSKFNRIIGKGYIGLDDDSIANIFIELQGENLVYKYNTVYLYIKSTWYKQCGEHNQLQAKITRDIIHYCNEQDRAFAQDIMETEDEEIKEGIRKKKDVLSKVIKQVKMASRTKSITKKIIHILSLLDFDDIEFDNMPDLFPFKTNLYDLNTYTFRDYKNTDYILTKTTYDYSEPSAEQEATIDKIFKEIFPNEDIRNDYKTILATTLFGRPVDKFIVSNGGGGNGKSVLHELLMTMLEEGIFAYVAPVSLLLAKLKQGANPELASMHNKRFIVYREPDDDEKINISTMKDLTGSNTLNARQLYSNETSITLRGTHILEANKTPKLKGQMDHSIKRRVIDINFESTFTNDTELIKYFKNHFPINPHYRTGEFRESHKNALFKYLSNFIQTFNETKSNKIYENIEVSETTKNRTTQYIANSDLLLSYTLNNTIENPKAFLKIQELYDHFKYSDIYANLPKDEMRQYTKKTFIETIIRHTKFRLVYKEIHQPYINGSQKCIRHCLIGYEIKREEIELEEY